MFNWHFLSILNALDVIRLFYLTGIYILGAKLFLGGFWGKMTSKTSNEIFLNACLESTSLRQTASMRHCAWTYLYACGLCAMKKAGMHARRKKSYKKCIFHVCVERPQTGGFQPNLDNVFVSPMLSNVQSFIVVTWEILELWGFEVSMLPYWMNPGRP